MKISVKQKILLICTGILSILYLSLHSQDICFKHFTNDNGLPATEVYDMIQDHNGYIWIATTYGVCRYDGYEFSTFTTKDGLADNTVIKLYEDYKGRIWFSSYPGDLSYYHNGSFHIHPINDEIRDITRSHIYLLVDTNDYIRFTSQNYSGKLLEITPDNEIIKKNFRKTDTLASEYSLCIIPESDGLLIISLLKWNGFDTGSSITYNKDNKLYLGINKEEIELRCQYSFIGKSEYLLSVNNRLFHIINSELVNEFTLPSLITDIYPDNRNNIWISIHNHGVWMYSDSDLDSEPVIYFEDEIVSKVIQDHNDNYWISTNGNGIYVIPSFSFRFPEENHEFHEQNTLWIKSINDHLYFYTRDKKMYKYSPLNHDITRVDSLYFTDKSGVCNDIFLDSKGNLWVLGSEYLCYPKNKKPLKPDFIENSYQVIELQNGSVALTSFYGINIYENNKKYNNPFDLNLKIRIRSLYEDVDQNLWLGTLNGLYSYHNNNLVFWGDKFPDLSNRITRLCGNDKILLAGTKNNGIMALYNNYTGCVKLQGINGEAILSMEFENDSSVWVGTNMGLSNISFSMDDSVEYSTRNFTTWDGLPSDVVNGICYYNEKIYLATEKGIVNFDPGSLKADLSPPKINIESVVIGGRDTTIQKSYELKHFQNNLKIGFKGIHNKSFGKIIYKYKIEGLNDNWITTKNTNVEYASIPPGNYKFMVKARSINGVWSDNTAGFSFFRKKAFWETIWFRTSLTIIVVLIIIFVSRHLLQIKQRDNELLTYRQKALSKQLNPHFLYNSLNSIQRFIIENNSIDSSRYLSQFSKLMRMILEISAKEFVTLQDEITSLKFYLELESLRFKDKLIYDIEVDPKISKEDTLIPTFIIQPFIENAIWHGLMLKTKNPTIEIKLTEKQSYIECTVKDNGVGRQKSGEINKNRVLKHRKTSTGIATIKQRLDLYNKRYGSSSRFSIEDLHNSDGSPAGTIVSIKLSKRVTRDYHTKLI